MIWILRLVIWIAIVLIIWKASTILGLILAIYALSINIPFIIKVRQKKTKEDQTASIQQRAREITGASLIGSALHVAGHPRLEMKQPVVLALRQKTLSIYPYD